MKLDTETLDILDNFCSINTQMYFRKGNRVTSKSTLETVAAIATVPDSFERDFVIYDLKKFLGVMTLFDNPELKFDTHQVVIGSDKQKIKYSYTDLESITAGPDPDNMPDLGKAYIQFTLKSNVFKDALKASSVLGSSEVAIAGENGVLSIRAFDKKNPVCDTYSYDIGETSNEFLVIFNNDSLKLIPQDYEVTIHKLPKVSLAKFVSPKVTYFIALDKDSKFS